MSPPLNECNKQGDSCGNVTLTQSRRLDYRDYRDNYNIIYCLAKVGPVAHISRPRHLGHGKKIKI